MTFGEVGKKGARVHDLKDVEEILDVFQAHGHKEVISAVLALQVTYSLVDTHRSTPPARTAEVRARSTSER